MTRLEQLYELRDRVARDIALEEAFVARKRARVLADAAAERRRLLGRKKKLNRAVCGTDGGYYRHRRYLKEPACELCKLAHAAAERDRLSRRAS